MKDFKFFQKETPKDSPLGMYLEQIWEERGYGRNDIIGPQGNQGNIGVVGVDMTCHSDTMMRINVGIGGYELLNEIIDNE